MVEPSTRAVVEELYAAYSRKDFDRVASLIHDDIDWAIYGPMQVFPFAGARQGKAAVLEALGSMAKDYQLERYQPKIVIVEGDRAAIMSEVAFRQRTTDRILSFQVANFLRLSEGRVIEFREFANSFDLVEQALGHFIQVA
jgi:ketosteroid isomerase-like protein